MKNERLYEPLIAVPVGEENKKFQELMAIERKKFENGEIDHISFKKIKELANKEGNNETKI